MISILYAITSLACDKLKLNCAVDDAVDWRLSLARFWESNFNKLAVGKYESARSRLPLQASPIPKYICTSLQRVNDRFFYVSRRVTIFLATVLTYPASEITLPLNISCLARYSTRKLFGCQGTRYIRANT